MLPELTALISGAHHLVAFTGAGVSTLSGLPDFRGKGGVYSNPANATVFDIDVFRRDPTHYYTSFCRALYQNHDLKASLIHNALADLERQGVLKALITQNIDLLHQKAGSQTVIEVHGSPLIHRCLTCGRTVAFDEMCRRVNDGDIPPRCSCGGFLKPEITFFGEALPEAAFREARRHAERADVMLVLGSSLTVHPAASLPALTHQRGGKLVIINNQPTPLDSAATLRLWDLEQAFL